MHYLKSRIKHPLCKELGTHKYFSPLCNGGLSICAGQLYVIHLSPDLLCRHSRGNDSCTELMIRPTRVTNTQMYACACSDIVCTQSAHPRSNGWKSFEIMLDPAQVQRQGFFNRSRLKAFFLLAINVRTYRMHHLKNYIQFPLRGEIQVHKAFSHRCNGGTRPCSGC